MTTSFGQSPGHRVLMLNLPWASFNEPSPALGVLKKVLLNRGVGCDVLEAPMLLLRYLKASTYRWIRDLSGVNDFVFTRDFEEKVHPEQTEALERLLEDRGLSAEKSGLSRSIAEGVIDKILKIRQDVIPRFVDDVLADIDLSAYCLVGFTCMYDQTFASIALARRIKQRNPDLLLAFGGYALQRPVGPALQRVFQEIDVVAYGDGEAVIGPLYEAALGRRSLSEVPNITYRAPDRSIVESGVTIKIGLDESPTPDYDDYFRQREVMRDRHKVTILTAELAVESSRGCWYGQKNHCTFCGIDDETLKYRVKSAPLVLKQLDELHERYGAEWFRFADNILPVRYFKEFLPALVSRGAPYKLMYEIKANLNADQIELCAKAGISALQPGIESFSTPVLKLMDKGVSAAQNLFTVCSLMRWGIYPIYNILYGFPFESPEHYYPMLKLMRKLYHLVPPHSVTEVQILRYSPLSDYPERFGAAGPLRADRCYEVIFSDSFRKSHGLAPEDFCYRFANPYDGVSDELRQAHLDLKKLHVEWDARFKSGAARLTYTEPGGELVVRDTRTGDEEEVYRFGRAHRLVGQVLRGQFLPYARLEQELNGLSVGEREARGAIRDLEDAGTVVDVDGKYVWLAQEKTGSELFPWDESAPPRHNLEVRESSSFDLSLVAASASSGESKARA